MTQLIFPSSVNDNMDKQLKIHKVNCVDYSLLKYYNANYKTSD